MHYMKRGRNPVDGPRLLPLDWKAGDFTVMIGRGRRCIHNVGNVRFRAMVKEELQAYSAGRKAKKSSIIKRILREINNRCDDGVGFVKQDVMTGRYYTATVTAAKVTIAQAFRDALHDIGGYKSSKQHKQLKRDIARGKVDLPLLCAACKEDACNEEAANSPQDTEGKTSSNLPALAPVEAVRDAVSSAAEVTSLQASAPASAAAIRDASPSAANGEASLEFWGECIDPLVEFERANVDNQTTNTNDPANDDNKGDLTPNAHYICGCASHHNRNHDDANGPRRWHPINEASAAPHAPVMDPFEPIPLEDAMDGIVPSPEVESTGWETMIPEEENNLIALHHDEEENSSESSSSSLNLFEADDNDEEDHAILVWASEFVDCPLCSLVQGRGDFDELPIQDIRKALIG